MSPRITIQSRERVRAQTQSTGTGNQVPMRRAMALLIVLVSTVIMALGAYAFCDFMISQREAVELSGRQIAARALVESGVEYARMFMLQDAATQLEAGGTFNNPDRFQAQLVSEHPDWLTRGLVTFVAPNLDEDGYVSGTRYGLQDESNRLNLNALQFMEAQQEGGGSALLMSLPGMTEDVADAILDWIDDDDETREYGAESDYYEGLTPPYRARNGAMASVEDLLLVRGVTPELLFGLDVNHNGLIDANEMANTVSGEVEPEMMLGWSHYLTLYSKEANRTKNGDPRVFVNMEDMKQLDTELRKVFSNEWATFIVAYRQNGPSSGSSSSGGSSGGGKSSGRSRSSGKLDLTQPGTVELASALDLIDATVSVTYSGDDSATTLDSPFKSDIINMGLTLPSLMDNLTVNPTEYIPGRININQAPRRLIEGIPGISEEVIAEIMSRREFEPSDPESDRDHEMWLLTEGVVTLTEMKLLIPFVNAGGSVYRAQLVGYFDDGVGSSRAEVVLDATQATPLVLFWRDLSHLGRGYSLDTLGFDNVVE